MDDVFNDIIVAAEKNSSLVSSSVSSVVVVAQEQQEEQEQVEAASPAAPPPAVVDMAALMAAIAKTETVAEDAKGEEKVRTIPDGENLAAPNAAVLPQQASSPSAVSSVKKTAAAPVRATLNVGGERFEVALVTLKKFPGTLFETVAKAVSHADPDCIPEDPSMGEGKAVYDRAAHEVFVDRSAKVFEPLLSFVRNNSPASCRAGTAKLRLPRAQGKFITEEMLLDEVDFWGLAVYLSEEQVGEATAAAAGASKRGSKSTKRGGKRGLRRKDTYGFDVEEDSFSGSDDGLSDASSRFSSDSESDLSLDLSNIVDGEASSTGKKCRGSTSDGEEMDRDEPEEEEPAEPTWEETFPEMPAHERFEACWERIHGDRKAMREAAIALEWTVCDFGDQDVIVLPEAPANTDQSQLDLSAIGAKTAPLPVLPPVVGMSADAGNSSLDDADRPSSSAAPREVLTLPPLPASMPDAISNEEFQAQKAARMGLNSTALEVAEGGIPAPVHLEREWIWALCLVYHRMNAFSSAASWLDRLEEVSPGDRDAATLRTLLEDKKSAVTTIGLVFGAVVAGFSFAILKMKENYA